MLAQGIRRTMVSAGAPDKALVLRKGSENELSSSVETKYKGLLLSAPGVKRDAMGAPLGAGEVVVVIAMNKIIFSFTPTPGILVGSAVAGGGWASWVASSPPRVRRAPRPSKPCAAERVGLTRVLDPRPLVWRRLPRPSGLGSSTGRGTHQRRFEHAAGAFEPS